VKTIKTQNVSIPVELHEWVLKKMEETKLSTPWAKVTFSSIVEHALVELQNNESQFSSQKTARKTTKAKSKKEEIPDNIIDPEKLYPNGLPPDMMAAINAERRRYAIATGTENLSKKKASSASKKLPKKNA